MTVYTVARIEIACFSVVAFGAGYLWPAWPALLTTAFLIWAGILMVKDTWDEERAA